MKIWIAAFVVLAGFCAHIPAAQAWEKKTRVDKLRNEAPMAEYTPQYQRVNLSWQQHQL